MSLNLRRVAGHPPTLAHVRAQASAERCDGTSSRSPVSARDPRYHTANIEAALDELIRHLREDMAKFDEPRARALFETSAGVLGGLRTAFAHYDSGAEAAMREPPGWARPKGARGGDMRRGLLSMLALLSLQVAMPAARAQGAPQVLWEIPTPSLLANSVQGIDWAPGTVARVAVGSTDRWVRVRRASSGALVYSVLQPHRSGSANQTVYSNDGAFLAVHNSNGGLGYRVLRASDGVFLGMLTATIDVNGIVRFAPDAQLLAATGGDGTLSRWRIAAFTAVRTVGSGYDKVSTTFNFSPDGLLQASATQGRITIQRRSTGSIVRQFAGGPAAGVAPMAFTPDGTRIAAWSNAPNATTLWRISDGAVLVRFRNAASNEGVTALRFSPDGLRLVTTGFLPFVGSDGTWEQRGTIRFWRVSDGALRRFFDARTGIGVTSPIAWSPDATRFAYGTYEGSVVAALTPAP